MNYKVVIPARLKSKRLPGKPLVDIGGKSLLLRTFERCLLAVPRDSICVLTDSAEIIEHCKKFEMPAEITSEDCFTGTDRVAEYASRTDYDHYINVQGDEPLMNPDDIIRVINAIRESPNSIINGYCTIDTIEDFNSYSIPKVVFKENRMLMYMSRSPIPGNKGNNFKGAYRQVCVYGFPRNSLKAFASRNNKAQFEAIEDIEILRFVEMGYDVKMIEMSSDSIAVDHPQDIQKVLARL